MVNKRNLRPISALRVFGFGGGNGFILDIVGHTFSLYWAGLPVTFSTIHAYGTRGFHAETWILSSFLVVGYGAYVLRQIVGTILNTREVKDDCGV